MPETIAIAELTAERAERAEIERLTAENAKLRDLVAFQESTINGLFAELLNFRPVPPNGAYQPRPTPPVLERPQATPPA